MNSDLFRDRSELRRRFRTAQPFPHLILDEFLDPVWCKELIDTFPEFDPTQAVNEMGDVGRKAVFPDLPSLGSAYRRFDELIQSHDFLSLIGDITGIPDLLYDSDYIGGGAHLNLGGQDLDTHVDFNYHPRTRTHRRLNLLLFLNTDWEDDWGGSLELQRDPHMPAAENCVVRISPAANRCVIFETSERSWHGFPRITREDAVRKSIAVYFYTKARPAEETAPNHGTVYVPRPLPDHLTAGHTLTESDIEELHLLIQRRDTQIQYLYGRELEYSRIAGSASFRLARVLLAPLRMLRSTLKIFGMRG